MKNSVSNRIKITKTGKILRRKMAQDHFRAKKSGKQMSRKQSLIAFDKTAKKTIIRYLYR